MSDWEDFCESNGMNVGSQDDYDRMLDGFDLGHGFVKSRRAGWPTEEITPTVGKEELIACLVEGVAEGGIDVFFNPTYFTEGEYQFDALDGLQAGPQLGFYLRLRSGPTTSSGPCNDYEHHVPISLLIDALRTGGVPLKSEEGWWVAWDYREQCLKVSPDALELHWRRALANKPLDSMDECELDLLRILNRAILSTDHGKKPLLIEREYLDDALNRREVEFDTPKKIAPENLERFAFVFYDAAGEPRALPSKRVADLGYPISTKCGTYIPTGGCLVPYLSEAQLIAGAFSIATQCNPNDLKWFLLRDRGSIFQSAIERMEEPKVDGAPTKTIGSVQWRDPDRQVYRAANSFEAVSNAKKISEWGAELGTVYLTEDWHPLNSLAVTTPVLYEYAITTLYKFGFDICYSWSGEVQIQKTNAVTPFVVG